MRILGIETSTLRGSVALADGIESVCDLEHQRENAHGESIQPLIEQALATAGWSVSSLDRIAVGIGPGSFTGLRVGIALAQGISEGLGIPLVGIGSLAAMALAVPRSEAGPRCAVLDARHGELFSGLYDAAGAELLSPWLAPDAIAITSRVEGEWDGAIYVGRAGASIPGGFPRHFSSPHADLPHAVWTARAAATETLPGSAQPLYVREAAIVRPKLPPNPLKPAR